MSDIAGAEPAAAALPSAAPVGPLDLIAHDEQLRDGIARLRAGSGPIAVDAERANGFRYSSKAYLVQLFRRGSGTLLIDPLHLTAWPELQAEIGDAEWVLHAASQDLPCLRELGLEPAAIFDTELGARLAGFERVGLAAVVERTLGLHLAKEHAASDWSERPIAPGLLTYAALDVELLVDVRDALARELETQGKTEIARQEFDAVRVRPQKEPSAEPWRRLGGIHQVRDRSVLAVVRALWLARDELARSTDSAPGRLIPDASLVVAALSGASSKGHLAALKSFHGRASRSELDRWWAAIERGRADQQPPVLRLPPEGPPPPKFWRSKRPVAAGRLQRARAAVQTLAASMTMPTENLLTPDTLRRMTWDSTDADRESVAAALASLGARPWQVDATAQEIADAFVEADQSPPEAAEPAS